jgi:hypothetical protein
MNVNKKTIALVSALALVPNTYGMWPSMDFARNAVAGIAEYASAAQPAVNTACRKTWSKIKENKGYIGAAATAAGLVYGGIKAYQYYTAQPEIAPAVTAQAAVLLDGVVIPEDSIIFETPLPSPSEESASTTLDIEELCARLTIIADERRHDLEADLDVAIQQPGSTNRSNHPPLIHGRNYRISSSNNVRELKYIGRSHRAFEGLCNEDTVDLNSSSDAEVYYFKSLELDPQSQEYNTYGISAKALKARVIRDITENQRRVRFNLPGDTTDKE